MTVFLDVTSIIVVNISYGLVFDVTSIIVVNISYGLVF